MSMYLEHFGLREAPFRITPHTDFFFDGANRGATLDALLYAVINDEGIVKVTGEVGSGKTMLCRMLLERLPPHVETVYLANPSLSRDELLFALADELNIPSAPQRVHLLLRELQQHLIHLYSEGKQVLVLIDEANAMPAESLEEIRLLSNLESRQHKLLQIVLFGQPELNTILSAQDMRQLRERVTHNFNLEPLQQTDIASYLMFRLRTAGYHGPDLFTPAAIKLFAKASQGLTRRLNILADKALLAAFASNTHQIDVAQSKAAIKDAQFEEIAPEKPAAWRRPRAAWIGLGAALSVALAGLGIWLVRASPVASAPPSSAATTVTAPAASVPPALAATPTTATTAPVAAPAAAPVAAPAPLLTAAGVTVSPVASDFAAAPALRLDTQAASLQPSPEIDELKQRFDRWIRLVDDRHHVIQLLRVPAENKKAMETLLDEDFAPLQREALRIYEAKAGNQRWLGLVYGDFAAFSEAESAMRELPSLVSRHQPFIRPVHQLKH